jgi:adenylosuccinate lyase
MYYTKEKSDLWHEHHDASVVILQCSKNISRSFKREIWQYQKINYEKFEEKINEILLYFSVFYIDSCELQNFPS